MARFEPGQSGNPAGKPAGTPSKKYLVKEACEKYNCDPFEILAQIAMGVLKGNNGKTLKIHVRTRMESAAELAQYLEPKLKAIEYKADKDNPFTFGVYLGDEATQKLARENAELKKRLAEQASIEDK